MNSKRNDNHLLNKRTPCRHHTPTVKTNGGFFKQLNKKVVSDNKKFWQAISLLFSEKAFCKETIVLKIATEQ